MRKKLGEMLIEAGAIDDDQLRSALSHQQRWGGRLGKALIDLNFTTEELIVGALAKKYNYPRVTFDEIAASKTLPQALKLTTREFAEQYSLVPYATEGRQNNGTIWVAISDPSQFAGVDALSFKTGCKIIIALASDADLADSIRRHYYGEHIVRNADTHRAAPPSGGEPAGFASVPRGGRSKGGLRSPSLTPAPHTAGFLNEAADSEGQSDLSHFEEPAALTTSSLKTLTEEELALLKELELYAQGQAPPQAKVKPIQLVAAVLQVLLKRQLISELELLEELTRKK